MDNPANSECWSDGFRLVRDYRLSGPFRPGEINLRLRCAQTNHIKDVFDCLVCTGAGCAGCLINDESFGPIADEYLLCASVHASGEIGDIDSVGDAT